MKCLISNGNVWLLIDDFCCLANMSTIWDIIVLLEYIIIKVYCAGEKKKNLSISFHLLSASLLSERSNWDINQNSFEIFLVNGAASRETCRFHLADNKLGRKFLTTAKFYKVCTLQRKALCYCLINRNSIQFTIQFSLCFGVKEAYFA